MRDNQTARDAAAYIRIVMRSLFCLLLVAEMLPASCLAQSSRSARSLALAGSEVAEARSCLDVNPAFSTDSGLALQIRATPSADYVDAAFEAGVSADVTVGDVRAGIAADRLGYGDIYTLSEFTGASAVTLHALDRTALAGVRVRYDRESFDAHSTAVSSYAIDIGFRMTLDSDVSLGFASEQLIASPGGSARELLGIGYRLSDATLLATVVLSNDRLAYRFGADVPIASRIALLAGTSTDTGVLAAGVSVGYNAFVLDLSIARHPALGTSLTLGLGWSAT